MQYQLDSLGNYHFTGPVSEAIILSVAERIREDRFRREDVLRNPTTANFTQAGHRFRSKPGQRFTHAGPVG